MLDKNPILLYNCINSLTQMGGTMEFKFDEHLPIYKQLVEQIKVGILTGTYPCGEKLPSVRDLAILTKVNPNTIQRALLELEEEGLITTKRTSGKFVTDNMKLIQKMKDSQAETLTMKFLDDCHQLGISYQMIFKMLKEKGEKYESN